MRAAPWLLFVVMFVLFLACLAGGGLPAFGLLRVLGGTWVWVELWLELFS
jgi:hypothetical protein